MKISSHIQISSPFKSILEIKYGIQSLVRSTMANPPSTNSAFPSSSAFPNSITEKVNYSNFLLWRQQIKPVINLYKLQRFVPNPSIQPQFLFDNDHKEGIENPACETWEQQDQVLLTWLQSPLSLLILSRVLGSIHSYQVWEKIQDYFHKQTRAKAQQLQTELCATVLNDKTMCKFLLRIKALTDGLASVGNLISPP